MIMPQRLKTNRNAGPDGGHRRRSGGFTLIELSVVILIIGLIVTFILRASAEAVSRAEIRATQALITKLEVGVSERIEALLSQRVTPNGAHRCLAATYPPGIAPLALPWGLPSESRAAVIARFDQIRAELPDVFIINTSDPNFDPNYPINFAGQAYPGTTVGPNQAYSYAYPIGSMTIPLYQPDPSYDPSLGTPPTNLGPGGYVAGTFARGFYGASFEAAGGLYKLLGYRTQGYDLVDNDGDGMIDEFDEGTGGASSALATDILNRLGKHTHKTARSEMLYATLVEGVGPLGSVFTPDDFTDREVRDTDGDGLPEFVDAWGEPIQFYRWPVHHISTIQKGWQPYSGPIEPRQQNPLDPNNQLVAPAWWTASYNANPMLLGECHVHDQRQWHDLHVLLPVACRVQCGPAELDRGRLGVLVGSRWIRHLDQPDRGASRVLFPVPDRLFRAGSSAGDRATRV